MDDKIIKMTIAHTDIVTSFPSPGGLKNVLCRIMPDLNEANTEAKTGVRFEISYLIYLCLHVSLASIYLQTLDHPHGVQ